MTTFAFDPALRLPIDEAFYLAKHATRIGFLEAPVSIERFRDENPGGTLCLSMIGMGWNDYYCEAVSSESI